MIYVSFLLINFNIRETIYELETKVEENVSFAYVLVGSKILHLQPSLNPLKSAGILFMVRARSATYRECQRS